MEIPDPVSNNRHWASLVCHESDIRNDPDKMEAFAWTKENLTKFFGGRDQLPQENELFTIFCKKSINAHGIFDNFGEMTGIGLDFRASGYDHSCRPNIGISFQGSTVIFRALDPKINILDRSTAFLSYTELTESKKRRQAELRRNYYFDCACPRCLDPEDNYLTSARCPFEDCHGLVEIDEDTDVTDSRPCKECGQLVAIEILVQAQNFMQETDENLKDLREIYETDSSKGLDLCDSFIQQGKRILHEKNVYLADFMTLFVQWVLLRREKQHMASAVRDYTQIR